MARGCRDNRKRLPWWGKTVVFLAAVVVLGGVLYGGGKALLYALYPCDYAEQAKAVAEENELPLSLIYATIHTESRFQAEAVSTAGAIGLMQLTEIAFTEAQNKRDGTVTMTAESLYDPTINLCYGGYYLKRMIKRFGNVETALAAYNAGQSRVAGWLKNSAYSKDGKTLLYIPYEETRNYVEKVLKTQEIYQRLYEIE